MSPLLFALFVNNIEDHILANGCSYVNIDNVALGNYIKLSVLIYAHDTILIADSEENLQKAITCMETYCCTWTLIANESKTKVIIFGKTKVKTNFKFIYNEALDNYIECLVQMYVDDTILIADSEENLQKSITCMETYCCTWTLIANESKTKVIILGKIM